MLMFSCLTPHRSKKEENAENPIGEMTPMEDNQSIMLGRDNLCGLCSLRPKWLQTFANKQTFLIIFCATSILQGMYYTYFVSVLTTIEKLYQIQSKTTGIIMSATEMGQIGGALLLTYYGGQGHRPRWIACGMLVFALASVLCSAPHQLYGGQSFVSSIPPSSPANNQTSQLDQINQGKLCINFNKSYLPVALNELHEVYHGDGYISGSTYLSTSVQSTKCGDPELSIAQSRVTQSVLIIFFCSLFFIGIGSTAVNTLGIPYIDDNVAPRESPLYFAITIGVRIFGPVLGFVLGSVCTSIFVDFPFSTGPGLTPTDPQWIGAWWLGVLIVGFALTVTSLPMMAFPKNLPKPDPLSYCHKQQQESLKEREALVVKNGLSPPSAKEGAALDEQLVKSNAARPSLREFPVAVRRLLRNKILLYRTASSVLHILPIAGLYTFLPKYLESQFQLTASNANLIAGMAGILVMGIGIFASGIYMRKYKPSARFVAAWIAMAALLYAIGMVILMFLGCPLVDIVGLNAGTSSANTSEPTCDAACSCSFGEFSPICTSTGVTYISPCLAGCTQVSKLNSTITYSDCKCLAPTVTASNGYCASSCDSLTWYIVIFSSFVLIHSTCEVGSMMLTLRCVEPQDKAMALGLVSFAIGLFGNVPCPILYGAVVDSACLFWEYTCGQVGACRVYDPDKFRIVFHGITAAIMFMAFMVDAAVYWQATTIKFDEDDDDEQAVEDANVQKTANVQENSSTSSALLKPVNLTDNGAITEAGESSV
ncbi:Solute carrier organic anion transporter family member 3A1 [Halotydeus destructor]|nr:Solute carrier organic anion transporter family member 3A1 [Halotydeus destructor]